MRKNLLFIFFFFLQIQCYSQDRKSDVIIDLSGVYRGNLITFFEYASISGKLSPSYQEYYLFLKRKRAVIIVVPNEGNQSGGFASITKAKVDFLTPDSLHLRIKKVWIGTKNSRRYERDYRFRKSKLDKSENIEYHFRVLRKDDGHWLVDKGNNIKFFTNGAYQTNLHELVKRGLRCLW